MSDNKIRRKGIICPKLIPEYTWNRFEGPRNAEQHFELTFKDFDDMQPKLNGKPLIAQHGNVVVGQILNNWRDGDTWKIEFEVDGSTLAGQQEKMAVEGGLKDRLSLKHSRRGNEPIEVSLVWDEGRPGSMIVEAGAPKKNEDYKTSDGEPIISIPRNALLVMADSNTLHVTSDIEAKKLDSAIELAKAHQAKAAEADAKSKQLDRDAQGRFAPPTPKPAAAPAPANSAVPVPSTAPADPSFIPFPSLDQQLNAQLNAQIGPPSKTINPGGIGGVDMSLSSQMKMQIDSQIPPPAAATLPVAASSGPPISTGDSAMDAMLNDPKLPKEYRDFLLNSAHHRMQKEKELEAKLAQTMEEAQRHKQTSDTNQKLINDYKDVYMLTNMEFQRKILNNVNPAAESQLRQEVAAGKLDAVILSDFSRAEIAAKRQAIIEFDQKQVANKATVDLFDKEQRHRADLIRQHNQRQPTGFGPTPMVIDNSVAASAPAPPLPPSFNYKDVNAYGITAQPSSQVVAAAALPLRPMEPEDDIVSAGAVRSWDRVEMKPSMGDVNEYRSKAADVGPQPWEKEGFPRLPYFYQNIVAASAPITTQGSHRPIRRLAEWEGTFNQHLNLNVHAGIISETTARYIAANPKETAENVVAAAQVPGGIGSVPKPTIERGRDHSWCAGLTKERFLPRTLEILQANGSEVGYTFPNPFYDPNMRGRGDGHSFKRQKA